MFKSKQSVLFSVTVFLGVIAIFAFFPRAETRLQQPAPAPLPVEVDAPLPLPVEVEAPIQVQEPVQMYATVPVPVVVQSSVSLQSPVEVEASEPLPVEVEAQEPFTAGGHFQLNGSESGLVNEPLTTVPAGKRLVIEYVTAQIILYDIGYDPSDPEPQLLEVSLDDDSTGYEYFFDAQPQGEWFVFGSTYYVVSQETRIYVEPEDTVELSVLRQRSTLNSSSMTIDASISFSLSGYLEDVGP